MHARFILIFFLSLSLCPVYADTIPYTSTGFRAHYGFIIPHSRAIEEVSHTNPYGFEISINRLQTSYSRWQVFNSYWFSGVQAGYFNYQYPEVLGSVFDLTVYAEPVLKYGPDYFFTVRGGMGLSYHTRFYDKDENPLNQFFSTSLNFPLFVELRFKYRVAGRTYMTLSGCYNHISNGGFKQPNKGMNFPTVAIGLENFNKIATSLDHSYSSEAYLTGRIISFSVQALTALKILEETDIYPEEPVLVYGVSGRFARQAKTWYSLNAGIEMIVDGYLRGLVRREGTGPDHKRLAITAGQDFLLGKVIFTQYLGFYIYSPFKARSPVYQKYELAYKLLPGLSAGVYLKAHLHVAELMGLNVSYTIMKKQKPAG